MNVNEVIAHLASAYEEIHPNDHVNASQSSNDSFPTCMHMALCEMLIDDLLPELIHFKEALKKKILEFEGIIRIGRTHLQDAVPISLSQSFSAYFNFINEAIDHIHISLDQLYELPIGSTAVGTGINTIDGFSEMVVNALAKETKIAFVVANNPFAILSSHNAICNNSAQLATLASNLNKIASDIRLLGSGPRCGLGELILPSNEPGSSIMPGKINPTQCEAMSMVCLKVMNNHQLILQCNAQGHFELNTYKPLIIYTVLQSCGLLKDACLQFREKLLSGLNANEEKIAENLKQSLMLITALKPIIGYENCSKIALHAHEHNLGLKEAGLELKLITEDQFNEYVKPEDMI
jgi:fumarate hydratase class II